MSGVNKAILLGRLGNEPEINYLKDGTAVSNFSIATSETWNDRDGKKQEKTEWHKLTAYGKTAELIGKYVHKGNQVYVEGKIQTRSYVGPNDEKRYITEVVVNNVQFLGSTSEPKEDTKTNQPQLATDNIPF